MAKAKVIPLIQKHPGDALEDAAMRFGEIRGELLLASKVLSNSAFTDLDISTEHDISAVLVLERAVAKLAALQEEIDTITVKINQPRAVAKLKGERKAVAHG